MTHVIKKMQLPVFYGTFSDLSKLDLSFINARFVKYKSRNFKNIVKKNLLKKDFEDSYRYVFEDYSKSDFYEKGNTCRYILLPFNFEKKMRWEECHLIYQLILCIYPTDLRLVHLIDLELHDNKWEFSGARSWNYETVGDTTFSNFLYIHHTEFRFINSFLKRYYLVPSKLRYLSYIINLFINAIQEQNRVFSFLNLCICLEVIVPGKEQLSYRLRRNVAIICGNSPETCYFIYQNINSIYNLRSSIVHGAITPNYKLLNEYWQYLRCIVAKLIRELLIHNISSIEELDSKLTALGFGQNNKLSKNYKYQKFPVKDNMEVEFTTITKK